MKFKEFDCVRVVRPVPPGRLDRGVSEAPEIQPGDVGTVLLVHTSPHLETAYTVECVGPRGEARWLAELFDYELEPALPRTAAFEPQAS